MKINDLTQKEKEQTKTIDYLENELGKKRNQLDRLKNLENLFNNGEFEEFQKAKLSAPQNGMIPEIVPEGKFRDQSSQSRRTNNSCRAGKDYSLFEERKWEIERENKKQQKWVGNFERILGR